MGDLHAYDWSSIQTRPKCLLQPQGLLSHYSIRFLSYTFWPRLAKWRGGRYGLSFLPGVSPKALKRSVRQFGGSLQTRSDKALGPNVQPVHPRLDQLLQPFYKSELYSTLLRIDVHLVRWGLRKFKPFGQRPRSARNPIIAGTVRSLAAGAWQRLNAGSRMSREAHVRFWKRGGESPSHGSLAPGAPGRALRSQRRADRTVDDGRCRGMGL